MRCKIDSLYFKCIAATNRREMIKFILHHTKIGRIDQKTVQKLRLEIEWHTIAIQYLLKKKLQA